MPFALIFVGMVLVVTGLRDTYKQLGTMVAGDMTGQRGGAGFVMFAAAIGLVGALGAIRELRTFSHYFLALIIVSLLLHNSGVLQKFLAALKGSTAATPVPSGTSASYAGYGGGTPLSGLFGSGLGSGLSTSSTPAPSAITVAFPKLGQSTQ